MQIKHRPDMRAGVDDIRAQRIAQGFEQRRMQTRSDLYVLLCKAVKKADDLKEYGNLGAELRRARDQVANDINVDC